MAGALRWIGLLAHLVVVDAIQMSVYLEADQHAMNGRDSLHANASKQVSGGGPFSMGVCMPTTPYVLNQCCPPNYVNINDIETCRRAYDFLAPGGPWGGQADRTNRPSGCYRYTGNSNTHFNSINVVGNWLYGDDQVICQGQPSPSPTLSPTSSPTLSPTSSPTVSPTSSPTLSPTSSPTLTPTLTPTPSPTPSPTSSPTSSPTLSPTLSPTVMPTYVPTPCLDPTCKVVEDPHITIFDGAQVSLANGMELGVIARTPDSLGAKWLVKSPSVFIQAKYVSNDVVPKKNAFASAVAVGGPFLLNNVLVIPCLSSSVTWNWRPILVDIPSAFDVPGLIEAKSSADSRLVQDKEKRSPGLDFQLPNGVKLLVNRYQSHVNVEITMKPSAEPQDGLCGNFNGFSADDTPEFVEKRESIDVRPSEILFA